MCDQESKLWDIKDVQRALARPLLGLPAQLRLAPAYRAEELQDRQPPPAPKQASVLVLFYPFDGQIAFPLTRRTDTVESHKGQISLPGGAREGDETLQATALRETCEELNACPDTVEVVGHLSPLYIPPSGYLINPFVAYSATRPDFRPDPREVAELIETPLSLVLDPDTIKWEQWTLHGTAVDVPFFDIYGHKVWGATAMVLGELIAMLHEATT
jgi:8-oxo-dGTP pyrophosphatase MutT (NUDIX family)